MGSSGHGRQTRGSVRQGNDRVPSRGRIDETSQPGIPRIRSEDDRSRAIPHELEAHLGIAMVVISGSLPAKDFEAFDAVAVRK